MVVITAASLWIRVVKWRLVLGKGANAIGVFFLSKAAGEWSPGRIGELSPLLIKKHRNARMAAWIVVDRILEMSVTIGLGVLGMATVQMENRRTMVLFACVIGLLLVLALYLLTRERMFTALAERFSAGGLPHRIAMTAARVSVAASAMRNQLAVPFAITIAAGCLDAWAGMLLYQSFGWPVSFALIATAKGVHAVTSAIPITPNATGVPYLTTAVLIHEVGGVPAEVLAVAVGLSIVVTNAIFWLSLAVGAANLREQSGRGATA